jgi:hypothetical protein
MVAAAGPRGRGRKQNTGQNGEGRSQQQSPTEAD